MNDGNYGNYGKKRIAVACQGGGSHTAFTAGVLKDLLARGHEEHDFVAFSGTSGGAICALLAWYALLEHGDGEAGAAEAERLLDKFWLVDNAARAPQERLFNDWLVGFLRWQKATGLLVEGSPNVFSDYWQDRLKRSLENNVPFDRLDGKLVGPSSPRLSVGAVDVLTGSFKVFGSHRRDSHGDSWVFDDDPESGIGVGAVLASAAIPPVFRSVRVGGGVYWDGLFSQNPPVRELLDARPDEVWVIQINPSGVSARPGGAVPGDEPTSAVDILDRRNELAGNLSLNQELLYVEKMNALVDELGEETPDGKRLRLRRRGKEYRRVVVRKIEMSLPLGAASKLDRSPSFIRRMLDYGERRAAEFFETLAFERAWTSGDPEATLGFFAGDAEVSLGPPFGERASYTGGPARDFVRERLTGGGVRIDPLKKRVAGESATWTAEVSPRLCADGAADPVKCTAEAVFERGKIKSLTLAANPDAYRPRR